jgi:hypothetical protein
MEATRSFQTLNPLMNIQRHNLHDYFLYVSCRENVKSNTAYFIFLYSKEKGTC